jgi:hypothetical protein
MQPQAGGPDLLEIPFGDRPHDVHAVLQSNLVELLGVRVAGLDRGAQLVEYPTIAAGV